MTRILLIEDDLLFRKCLSMAIVEAGWDCHALPGAQQCCRAVDEFSPDLAVVDMLLAGGPGGLEVAHQLRVARPELPIVLTTGYFLDEPRVKSMSGLVDRVLFKPFRTEEFIGTIREVLAARLAPCAEPAACQTGVGDERSRRT